MKDELRKQIYTNLNLRETEDLLDIWQEQDTEEWQPEVFEIVAQILTERLGQAPPQPVVVDIDHLLEQADSALKAGNFDQALSDCELAIQMAPDLAEVYTARGLVYDEMGQFDKALADYRQALRLDPESEEAADYLKSAEEDLAENFESSPAKGHLDRALELAWDDQPEQALEECALARQSLPKVATAYNALGLVLEELEHLEPAIEAYLEALQLNPELHAARKNLRNARLKLEVEQYRRAAYQNQDATGVQESAPKDEGAGLADFDETQEIEAPAQDEPVPGWIYEGEKEFILRGWPGHRVHPGRSGYDPLDTDFEYGHMSGVMLKMLGTFKFRTHNPFYLALMAFLGLLCFLPLMLGLGAWSDMRGIAIIGFAVIIIPCMAVGIVLLVNIAASLLTKKPKEAEENGDVFF